MVGTEQKKTILKREGILQLIAIHGYTQQSLKWGAVIPPIRVRKALPKITIVIPVARVKFFQSFFSNETTPVIFFRVSSVSSDRENVIHRAKPRPVLTARLLDSQSTRVPLRSRRIQVYGLPGIHRQNQSRNGDNGSIYLARKSDQSGSNTISTLRMNAISLPINFL
jgi:hypothetical protein